MTSKQLIDGYATWLSKFSWNWFGTLTFRNHKLPFWRANRIFQDWIFEIEMGAGTGSFRWFRVTERGAYGDNLHFHILVGGLRDASKWPWTVLWNEMAGDALITYYFRSGGATKYIVKTARPGRDFEIDFRF